MSAFLVPADGPTPEEQSSEPPLRPKPPSAMDNIVNEERWCWAFFQVHQRWPENQDELRRWIADRPPRPEVAGGKGDGVRS